MELIHLGHSLWSRVLHQPLDCALFATACRLIMKSSRPGMQDATLHLQLFIVTSDLSLNLRQDPSLLV